MLLRLAVALGLLLLTTGWAPGVSVAQVTKIQHVVVIIQENRTVDNLFNGLPGANTVTSGHDSNGNVVTLKPELLTAGYDNPHGHVNWLSDCNASSGTCQMNGFNSETCSVCPVDGAYAYVPRTEVSAYWQMAEDYTFADNAFQTNQGPSFPAHCYLLSGTCTQSNGASLIAAENPYGSPGGCDSSPSASVQMIDSSGGEYHFAFPCFSRTSILTLLDNAGVPWKYYQANQGTGLWNAVDALKNYCPLLPCDSNPEFAQNVVSPSSQVLTDIANGNLASVVFVTPTALASDHAGVTNGTGPAWVASVVNAIGNSQYWDDTVIIVEWDDWGGWFDHVVPTIRTSYELGFRVPMIFISAYSINEVSHTAYESYGTPLKFIEEVFNLPSLNTTDYNAPSMDDAFNFNNSAAPYQSINLTQLGANYFLSQPVDNTIVDKD